MRGRRERSVYNNRVRAGRRMWIGKEITPTRAREFRCSNPIFPFVRLHLWSPHEVHRLVPKGGGFGGGGELDESIKFNGP